MSTDKTDPSHSRGILRASSIMSLGTLASRILGFVRDIIFARFFGTAAGADAFVVAFRIPNLFRDLLGEGAANSSFVPVMTEYKDRHPRELAPFLNAIIAWSFIVLCAVTLAGILFAPVVVQAIAPGFSAEPGKVGMAVTLTRLMFPYLIFIGLTAFFSAIQFTYGAFTMPALGPCLLNLALIASTLAAVRWMHEPVYGLAYGVLAGGALQLYFQWRPLRRHNVRFSPPVNAAALRHPGAKQVGRLIVPRIIGSAAYQLNVFVDTTCASLASVVGPGGISAIYYANRLVLLPVGIFAVSLVTAALPVFARHVVAGNLDEFRKSVRFSLENLLFFMLPSAMVLMLLAEPIVRVLFQRGVFDAHSTAQTAIAVFFFSLGLVFYGTSKVLTAAFHALQDTRTPVRVAFISLAVNAVLNVTLMFPMKLGGIALASSLASALSCGQLYALLVRRTGRFEPGFLLFVKKALLASAAQGLVMWAAWSSLHGMPEWLRIMVAATAGAVAYMWAASWLGLEQAGKILKVVSLGKK